METEKDKKPLDLKIEDIKEEIIKVINDAKLPAFLLEPIIKEIYNQILINKNKDLEVSKKKYQEIKELKGEK